MGQAGASVPRRQRLTPLKALTGTQPVLQVIDLVLKLCSLDDVPDDSLGGLHGEAVVLPGEAHDVFLAVSAPFLVRGDRLLRSHGHCSQPYHT